jgi:hypothetical protein
MRPKTKQEITRSRTTFPVNCKGALTELAFSLKYGERMECWYFIQMPCGTWRQFDVRWIGVTQEVVMDWPWEAEARIEQVRRVIADVDVFAVIRAQNVGQTLP